MILSLVFKVFKCFVCLLLTAKGCEPLAEMNWRVAQHGARVRPLQGLHVKTIPAKREPMLDYVVTRKSGHHMFSTLRELGPRLDHVVTRSGLVEIIRSNHMFSTLRDMKKPSDTTTISRTEGPFDTTTISDGTFDNEIGGLDKQNDINLLASGCSDDCPNKECTFTPRIGLEAGCASRIGLESGFTSRIGLEAGCTPRIGLEAGCTSRIEFQLNSFSKNPRINCRA